MGAQQPACSRPGSWLHSRWSQLEEGGLLGEENQAVSHLHNMIESPEAFLATLLGIFEVTTGVVTDLKNADCPGQLHFQTRCILRSLPPLSFFFLPET